jgi:hypothetical protein
MQLNSKHIVIFLTGAILLTPQLSLAKKGGNGGGGGGDPEPSVKYKAALVSGGFRFSAVEVTLNKRGNTFTGVVPLDMNRDGTTDIPGDQEPFLLPDDQKAWDDVFASCSLFDGIVDSVDVSTRWSIDNSGGKQAGTLGSNIRISFRDVVPADPFSDADVDFALIGTLTELHPTEVDDFSLTTLTNFSFFGSTKFEGCNTAGDLSRNSVLVITRIQ